jgi:hypothetical protein
MHSPKMVAARKSLSAHSANINVQRLVAEGCDDAMLLNSIAFARLLPDLYPPLAASRLRRLAIKLDEVLREMKALTPSIELPFIVDEREDGSAGFKMEPTGGDLHLWPEVEKDLQTKVACYDALAEMLTKRQLPTRAQVRMLAYLMPVVYVKSVTRKPHYRELCNLLRLVGIVKNEQQLQKAFTAASQKNPDVLLWMRAAMSTLQMLG